MKQTMKIWVQILKYILSWRRRQMNIIHPTPKEENTNTDEQIQMDEYFSHRHPTRLWSHRSPQPTRELWSNLLSNGSLCQTFSRSIVPRCSNKSILQNHWMKCLSILSNWKVMWNCPRASFILGSIPMESKRRRNSHWLTICEHYSNGCMHHKVTQLCN